MPMAMRLRGELRPCVDPLAVRATFMVLCLPTIQRSHTSHFPFRLKAYGYSVASSCFSACSRANARVGVAFGTFVAEVLPETFVRDVFGENNRFVRGRAAWHAGLGPEFPEPVERPDHFYRVSLCFSVPVHLLLCGVWAVLGLCRVDFRGPYVCKREWCG